MHLLIQLQNSNWFTKNNKKMLTLTSLKWILNAYTKINSSKKNQKQITHESSKSCMLQTGRKKPLEKLKRIKTISSTL